ncbi:MAG: hypothetical protein ACP5T3_00640 [Candidatus Micrarchaeia archaeon]
MTIYASRYNRQPDLNDYQRETVKDLECMAFLKYLASGPGGSKSRKDIYELLSTRIPEEGRAPNAKTALLLLESAGLIASDKNGIYSLTELGKQVEQQVYVIKTVREMAAFSETEGANRPAWQGRETRQEFGDYIKILGALCNAKKPMSLIEISDATYIPASDHYTHNCNAAGIQCDFAGSLDSLLSNLSMRGLIYYDYSKETFSITSDGYAAYAIASTPDWKSMSVFSLLSKITPNSQSNMEKLTSIANAFSDEALLLLVDIRISPEFYKDLPIAFDSEAYAGFSASRRGSAEQGGVYDYDADYDDHGAAINQQTLRRVLDKLTCARYISEKSDGFVLTKLGRQVADTVAPGVMDTLTALLRKV